MICNLQVVFFLFPTTFPRKLNTVLVFFQVVLQGHSVLLFCSSRKGCESTARHVAKFLKVTSVGPSDVSSEFSDAASAIEALRRCPSGLDPVLEETLPFGVAYHHAGLMVWKLPFLS